MVRNNFVQLLEKAQIEVEQLNFKANDRDRSLAVFEGFRRAVVFLMRSEDTTERSAVEQLEPKSQMLEFLLDFSGRYVAYRNRLAEVLKSLQSSESWSAAIESDPELCSAVQGLIHETEARCNAPGVNKVVCKDLEKAAAVARSEGDLGVLSVRVIGAHNLTVKNDGTSRLNVSVNLGDRTSCTKSIRGCPEPRWNSEEFVFDVSVSDWLMKLDVSDHRGEEIYHVGKLSVALADVIAHQGPMTLCRSFEDATHGELEFVIHFVGGSVPASQAGVAGSPPEQTSAIQTGPVTEVNCAASAPKEASAIPDAGTPWSGATTTARGAVSAQQLGKLWGACDASTTTPQSKPPSSAAATPQKNAPTLPVGRSDNGGTTKRVRADPWASSPKAPRTPSTAKAKAATPSKRANCTPKASSNPFKSSSTPAARENKTSNPFKAEKKESGVSTKLQKVFDNLWA